MDSEYIGIGLLIFLVVIGTPVWIAFGIGGATALIIGFDIDPELLVSMVYNKINAATLLSIPLFILTGECLGRGGAAQPLVRFLNSMMSHLPGGPAYVIIAGCMLFAAMASGGIAFIAGFSPVIMPMMLDMGYSKKFALGLMITASSLGVLIPPSIPLIIYGFITETSLKDLYTAAFLPGAMIAVMLCLTVFFHARRGHFKAPPPASWGERWEAFKKAWPVMLLPVLIMGPMYGGVCTATEAASIAAVYSIILGTVVYRQLSLRQLWEACSRTGHLVSMLLMIVSTAFMLNQALLYMRVPFELGDALTDADLHWTIFIIILTFAYLLMGMFLDPNSIMIIAPPIVLPALISMGYDPVAFGVLTVACIEMAMITPPFGIALFTASAVLDEEYDTVVKSCYMFYPAMIVGLFLIALVPDIALLL